MKFRRNPRHAKITRLTPACCMDELALILDHARSEREEIASSFAGRAVTA